MACLAQQIHILLLLLLCDILSLPLVYFRRQFVDFRNALLILHDGFFGLLEVVGRNVMLQICKVVITALFALLDISQTLVSCVVQIIRTYGRLTFCYAVSDSFITLFRTNLLLVAGFIHYLLG